MKLQLNKTALAVAQALACLAIAGCGGTDQEASTDDLAEDKTTEVLALSAPDKTARTIQLDATSAPTNSGTISASGRGSDDRWAYRVFWSNNRGGSGQAKLEGTKTSATWRVPNIQLQSGPNHLAFEAVDAL